MKAGGTIGNRNAANHKLWAEAIKRAIARRGPGLSAGLNKLADQFIDAVERGDVDFKELGDRLDGKAAQALDILDTRTEQRNLDDSELLAIATTSSSGTPIETGSKDEPEVVH